MELNPLFEKCKDLAERGVAMAKPIGVNGNVAKENWGERHRLSADGAKDSLQGSAAQRAPMVPSNRRQLGRCDCGVLGA